MSEALDRIDRHVVALLQAAGRSSYQELGDAVGLSAPATYQRVRKLEAVGVITG
jgi:Lrp/AsnC family leucine-responsive transcriptional regulator